MAVLAAPGGAPGAGGGKERAGYTTAAAFREQPSGNLGRLAKQHLPFILVAGQRAAILLDEFRISRLQTDRCTFASPIPSWIGPVDQPCDGTPPARSSKTNQARSRRAARRAREGAAKARRCGDLVV
jgi:hypothetical protein